MNRLTGWDKDNAYVLECFERNKDNGGCEDMDTTKCTFCEHFLAIFKRLAQYEDTGLSPEDVVRVNNFEQSQCAKLLVKNGQLQQENEQLKARIIAGVLDSDLVETYDGSALDKADQYIEKLEKENDQLNKAIRVWMGTANDLREAINKSEKIYNERINELKAQSARMRGMLEFIYIDAQFKDAQEEISIRNALKDILFDTPKDYHNPANVEALKQAREALRMSWNYTNEPWEEAQANSYKAIAAIDKVLGGVKE